MGRILLFSLLLIVFFFLFPSLVRAATCTASDLRFASSSNTLYVTGPVDCTLTDIKTLRPTTPLDVVNSSSKIWLLKTNLKLEQGARLILHGTTIGGDVNELRLKSNNTSATTSTIWLRADWGTIDIDTTKITSWNESANAPDTEYGSYKRSYIHARSRLEGSTPRESRLDIRNSDIGYLGFNGAEAYGLAWKVLGPIPSIFATVNVYGDVINSHIHHNYFGMYTFGAFGMNITGNEFNNNIQYGIDPHDDSDSLVIEGNFSHHNGNHGIICSQRCDHLTIRNNNSSFNTGNGIMLHRNTNESLVENNQVNDNGDSGLAIFDSHNNTLRHNTSLRNNHGIRLSVGSSNNLIEQNDFNDNDTHGIYFYKGSDAPTSGDGRPKFNRFVNNTAEDNGDYVIKLKEGDNNTFESNTFSNNDRELYIYAADSNTFVNNTFTGSDNFYHAKSDSDNTITDTNNFLVKLGDSSSSMMLVNTLNAVLQNSKNIPTTVNPTDAFINLTQTQAGGSSIVTFTKINLNVIPSASQIVIALQTWQTNTPFLKRWTEAAGSSEVTAQHTVGNLEPSESYDVVVNGAVFGTFIADGSGSIAFLYDGGYSGTKTFEVRESTSAATTLSEPSEEASEPGELQAPVPTDAAVATPPATIRLPRRPSLPKRPFRP